MAASRAHLGHAAVRAAPRGASANGGDDDAAVDAVAEAADRRRRHGGDAGGDGRQRRQPGADVPRRDDAALRRRPDTSGSCWARRTRTSCCSAATRAMRWASPRFRRRGCSDCAGRKRYSRPRQLRRRALSRTAPLFTAALEHVLEMEGGFTDDPHDPGGPTNRGITLKVFAAWKGVRLDQALERGVAGRAAAHRARYRARHLPRALLDAGALRRAQPGARLLPLRRGGQSRRHRRHAAVAARRRHRARRRDRPRHARRHRRAFRRRERCSATPRRAAIATARCTTSGASGAGGWRASTQRWRAQTAHSCRHNSNTQPTNRKDHRP